MNKDFITLEESKDQLIGKVGTSERDAYEEELNLYLIRDAELIFINNTSQIYYKHWFC